ncbi:MAG TPA: chloride channel protein [Geminicoccus sp.]|jgi:H+/Cl- antiporter ClcA|uniref:chloride channel protein n=1 Tax=Geminicoccus sp. TaxID=2024832 RepID=UPI002E364DB7|nr:chloride channel protein [Geminicoccus sp.]HEX2528181.1 chloride channel protein [Geminicoccus sp.]
MAASVRWWLRRQRRLLLSEARWRQQAVFWGGGALIGLVAVGFAAVADLAYGWLRLIIAWSPYVMLLVSPAGFALLAYLTGRYFQGAQGSGIPQTIAAREIDSPWARRALLSLRVAAGKVVMTTLALLFGASVGREGPTVQVGASIMHELGRLGGRHYDGLILAGGAAALAAAFNTPIAGIVFAVEELSRSFEQRNSRLVFSSVILAGLVSLGLVGDYTYFGTFAGHPFGGSIWLAVLLCGVVGGLLGGVFGRIVILLAFAERQPLLAPIVRHKVPFAAGCGLLVALIGLVTGGDTYGTGYEQARGLLEGTSHADPWFGLAKLGTTLLSTVSGIPGGIFSPSLAAGAGIGHGLSWLLPHVAVGAVVLLGMAGYFTGVVQAPITAVVIIVEMTGATSMTLPLMATAILALAASRLVSPDALYHTLSDRYLPRPKDRDAGAQRSAADGSKIT